MNSSEMQDIKRTIYGIVLTLVVAGIINAVALWYNTQSFIGTQTNINADQKEAIRALTQATSELRVQTTELKEQTKYLDQRLRLMEERK